MRISVGDIRLYVDVDGAGLLPDGSEMRVRPTIIVLHGGPGFDHSIFKPLLHRLTGRAQVVYYDHRGQGRSDRSSADKWNLAQWADDLVALCAALGIERPIVYGESFGGFVAQTYAVRHPSHPGALILDSTSARLDVEAMVPVFERLGGPAAAALARRFWSDPSPQNMGEYMATCMPLYDRTPDAFSPELMARAMPVANFDVLTHFAVHEQPIYDVRADLARVACPVLLMSGEDDPVTPMAGAEEIAAHLPDSLVRFERFANCGHGVLRDSPDLGWAVLESFLDSVV